MARLELVPNTTKDEIKEFISTLNKVMEQKNEILNY